MGSHIQMGRIKHYKWFITIVGAVVIVLLLRGFAFTSCLIPSTGMENTLFEGERIFVNKWSYGLRLPLINLWGYHRWQEKPASENDIVIFNNPAADPQLPIDKREVFISRCIGIPGDTLWVNSMFSVASLETRFNPDNKRLYAYPAHKETELLNIMDTLSIADQGLIDNNDTTHLRCFSRYEAYRLKEAINKQQSPWLCLVQQDTTEILYPIIVPGKGKTIQVYPWNITLLRNTLVMHEGKNAEIHNHTLYIDGKPAQQYTFTKDYYWMSSDNVINLSDSRLFGFVPLDHFIGKATFIWFSKEKDKPIGSGYRWERFFRKVE